jgi:hypothetical protein
MQAGGHRTARVAGGERRDGLPSRHCLPGPHARPYRLVGGPQAARMVDAHHLPTGHRAGEGDHTGAGRVHRGVRPASEVNAAMSGQPGPGWRREGPGHDGRTGQRPGPPRRRDQRARRMSQRDRRHGRGQEEHCGEDRQEPDGAGRGHAGKHRPLRGRRAWWSQDLWITGAAVDNAAARCQEPKPPSVGNEMSGFSSSSTLTSLKVITRTFFTNRAGRYMSQTQASCISTSK